MTEMGGGVLRATGSVMFTGYNNIERKVTAPLIFPKRGVGEAVCLTYVEKNDNFGLNGALHSM